MRIGIDLGGTKIEGIALEAKPRGGAACASTHRAATMPRRSTPSSRLSRISNATLGARGTVGVGIPGTLSPATGLVKNANSIWLIGRPLQADLEARLGREVRVANDANCFAVSEAADGAAAGADVVFGVIVGTGTGARHRRARSRRSPGRTASRESGGTTRCRGRWPTSCRARRATAARRDASRRSSPVPGCRAITNGAPAQRVAAAEIAARAARATRRRSDDRAL